MRDALIKLTPQIFLVLCIASCGPRFSGNDGPTSAPLVIGKYMPSQNAESYVAVYEIAADGACANPDESISFRYLLTESSAKIEGVETKCNQVKILSALEVDQTFKGKGRRPYQQELTSPKKPLIASQQGRSTLYVGVSERLYLAYSKSCIQLVLGSYGNRRGAEIEHTYCPSEESVNTKTLKSREIFLESFSDF